MNYRKPEIVVLGNASRVIEQINPKGGSLSDDGGVTPFTAPAYDLDE